MPQKKAAEQAERTWGVGRPLLYAAGACAGASGLYIAWQWLNASSLEEEKDTAAMLPPAPIQHAQIDARRWTEEAKKFVDSHGDMLLAHIRSALDALGASVSAEVKDAMRVENPRTWLIQEEQHGPDGQFVFSPDAFAKAVQADAKGQMAWDKESEGSAKHYGTVMRAIYDKQTRK